MSHSLLSRLAPAVPVALVLSVAALQASAETASLENETPVPGVSASPAAPTETPAGGEAGGDDSPILLESVLVSERGVSRANNILRPADIASTTVAGADPLLVLKRLPGVTNESSDLLGIRASSGTGLRLRAFGLSALALAIDDIPTPYYGSLAATSPNQLIEPENVFSTEVSPGTADVSTPSCSNLGGSLKIYTRGPSQEPGAIVSGTHGSNDLRRIYARVDTGEYNGFSAFVSGSDSEARSAFGSGNIDAHERQKYDVQARWRTDRLSITAAWSYFNADDLDDRSISGGYYQYLGKSRAELAALGVAVSSDLTDGGRDWFYPTTVSGDDSLDGSYWNKNRNGRTVELYSLRVEARPTDDLKITAIPYYQEREGYNHGAVPFSTALNFYADAQYYAFQNTGAYRTDIVAPIVTGSTAIGAGSAWLDAYVNAPTAADRTALRNSVAGGKAGARENVTWGKRYGVPLYFVWDPPSNHTIEAGVWIEQDKPGYIRRGHNTVGGIISNPFDRSGSWVTYYDNDFDIKTLQFHLKDTVKFIDDRLSVSAGVRTLYQRFNYKGVPSIKSWYLDERYDETFTFDEWFQPQAGATWTLNRTDELFVNLSRNYAAPTPDVVASNSFLDGTASIKPEESVNLDLGWRTARPKWSASLAGYVIQYENRIGSVTPYDPLGFGSASIGSDYANLGDVFGYGVELALAWAPFADLRLGLSVTWQQLEYDDDYEEPSGSSTVTRNIKGKTVTNTPEWIVNADATYYVGAWFAGVNARYVDSAYLTTSNNQSIPDYTLFGFGIGYDGIARPAHARLKHLRVALNIENAFDKHWYYASTGAAFSNGSFSVGSPRTVTLSATAKF
ncbi:outer membrane receptor protein [Opitutaceae bacterium TAV1]|nr:outer membrane receptor protein [Opitutaceae bacterium TAV1]